MTHNAQHKTDEGHNLPSLEAGTVPVTLPAQTKGKRLWAAAGLIVGMALCLAVLGVRSLHFSDTHTVNTAVAQAAEATDFALATETAKIADVTEIADVTDVADVTETPEIADVTEVADVAETPEIADVAEATEAPNTADLPAKLTETAPPADKSPKAAEKKADTPPKPPSIKLFGTVEFRGTLKGVPSWTTMLERNIKKPLLVAGAKLNSSTTWDDFKSKLSTMSPMEQLKAVNRFWNQWPYRLDPEVYKKPDYWATPDEFRRNSGDCEDYSIVKYYTLKEMGIPPDDMRIVVLMETIRNIAHAVLVVYIDGDAWILDNLSNNVLSHARYKNYNPQFSVNEKFRWAHVRPK